MAKQRKINWRIAVALIIAIGLIVLPAIVKDRYIIRLATLSIMYIGLACSLNLVTGFMGQMSLGHAAFLGIGAYTSAILAERLGMPFFITLPAAFVVSALFGVLLAVPAGKLSGSYLTIISLGFMEIIRIVETNWIALTNGPMGINGIARPVFFGYTIKSPAAFYVLGLILVTAIVILIVNITTSHVGRAIMSIREDPVASAAMGIPVFKYKVMTFALSAAFTGAIGAYYAHYMRYIDATAFNFDQSITIVSMMILGGSGSIPGSILGAVILTVLPEVARFLDRYRMLIYGLMIVLIMILRPKGLLGRTTFAQLLGIEHKYAEKPDAAHNGEG